MTNSSEAPTDKAKSARLIDVARRAGVSLATASKALNERGRISDATRLRVVAAARELAYARAGKPSPLPGRSGTVGLLTSDLEGRFSLPILMAAEDTFGAGQVSVFLCDARGDAIREKHYISALLNRNVDAIMVVGSKTDPRQPIAVDLPVPVIYVYTPSADPADLSITPDNVAGGRMALDHLFESGRTRIAHITGPQTERATIDRAEGIRQALEARNASLVYATPYGEWSERWGRSACAMLLDQGKKVDTILCDSDQIARGALDALRERGVLVPSDIAIMGFDNWDVIVEGAHPTLTSIDMNLSLLGRLAAESLFDAMEGKPRAAGVQLVPCRLAIRASTTQAI
ncbi:MAG: LacI family DNA-binding transcriptional regulator [Devosia sp.]|nr:LacI family DNA-binding transcriptional regulator [Devosia sp.]